MTCKLHIIPFPVLHTWVSCVCGYISLVSCLLLACFPPHRHSVLCLEPEPCWLLGTVSGELRKTPAFLQRSRHVQPDSISLSAIRRHHLPSTHWPMSYHLAAGICSISTKGSFVSYTVVRVPLSCIQLTEAKRALTR